MCQVKVSHKWDRWKMWFFQKVLSLFLSIRVGIRVRFLHGPHKAAGVSMFQMNQLAFWTWSLFQKTFSATHQFASQKFFVSYRGGRNSQKTVSWISSALARGRRFWWTTSDQLFGCCVPSMLYAKSPNRFHVVCSLPSTRDLSHFQRLAVQNRPMMFQVKSGISEFSISRGQV